ncbi:hypothetical protein [Reticulibacter mediterranei]|uniref:hypothetical protein n=1 Tax=Reticulibacter mediterranei TaxID=2778369 RepID=UPI001C68C7F2|nr:hypothetical protein [Reticulibacter mediterranei]
MKSENEEIKHRKTLLRCATWRGKGIARFMLLGGIWFLFIASTRIGLRSRWQELLNRKRDHRQTMCFTQRIEAVKAILGFGKNASGTNGTEDRLMSPSVTQQAVP